MRQYLNEPTLGLLRHLTGLRELVLVLRNDLSHLQNPCRAFVGQQEENGAELAEHFDEYLIEAAALPRRSLRRTPRSLAEIRLPKVRSLAVTIVGEPFRRPVRDHRTLLAHLGIGFTFVNLNWRGSSAAVDYRDRRCFRLALEPVLEQGGLRDRLQGVELTVERFGPAFDSPRTAIELSLFQTKQSGLNPLHVLVHLPLLLQPGDRLRLLHRLRQIQVGVADVQLDVPHVAAGIATAREGAPVEDGNGRQRRGGAVWVEEAWSLKAQLLTEQPGPPSRRLGQVKEGSLAGPFGVEGCCCAGLGLGVKLVKLDDDGRLAGEDEKEEEGTEGGPETEFRFEKAEISVRRQPPQQHLLLAAVLPRLLALHRRQAGTDHVPLRLHLQRRLQLQAGRLQLLRAGVLQLQQLYLGGQFRLAELADRALMVEAAQPPDALLVTGLAQPAEVQNSERQRAFLRFSVRLFGGGGRGGAGAGGSGGGRASGGGEGSGGGSDHLRFRGFGGGGRGGRGSICRCSGAYHYPGRASDGDQVCRFRGIQSGGKDDRCSCGRTSLSQSSLLWSPGRPAGQWWPVRRDGDDVRPKVNDTGRLLLLRAATELDDLPRLAEGEAEVSRRFRG
ncbi:hypothetical protein TYRP_022242 [Tyrophagus putrescentiae]|nr:hypothetical protein TYRP_022242 [Tyrophagus putrescentiae]